MNLSSMKRASSYSNIPRPSGASTSSSSSQSSCKKMRDNNNNNNDIVPSSYLRGKEMPNSSTSASSRSLNFNGTFLNATPPQQPVQFQLHQSSIAQQSLSQFNAQLTQQTSMLTSLSQRKISQQTPTQKQTHQSSLIQDQQPQQQSNTSNLHQNNSRNIFSALTGQPHGLPKQTPAAISIHQESEMQTASGTPTKMYAGSTTSQSSSAYKLNSRSSMLVNSNSQLALQQHQQLPPQSSFSHVRSHSNNANNTNSHNINFSLHGNTSSALSSSIFQQQQQQQQQLLQSSKGLASIPNFSQYNNQEKEEQPASMCTTRNLRDILKSCNNNNNNNSQVLSSSQKLYKQQQQQQQLLHQNQGMLSSSSSGRVFTTPSMTSSSLGTSAAATTSIHTNYEQHDLPQPPQMMMMLSQQLGGVGVGSTQKVNGEQYNNGIISRPPKTSKEGMSGVQQGFEVRDHRISSWNNERTILTDRSLNVVSPAMKSQMEGVAAVQKALGNNSSKEVEYYQMREKEFLLRIQLLEKENIRVAASMRGKGERAKSPNCFIPNEAGNSSNGNAVFAQRIEELQMLSYQLERRIEEIGGNHENNQVNEVLEEQQQQQQLRRDRQVLEIQEESQKIALQLGIDGKSSGGLQAAIRSLSELILKEQSQQNELKAQVKYVLDLKANKQQMNQLKNTHAQRQNNYTNNASVMKVLDIAAMQGNSR